MCIKYVRIKFDDNAIAPAKLTMASCFSVLHLTRPKILSPAILGSEDWEDRGIEVVVNHMTHFVCQRWTVNNTHLPNR